LRHQAAVLAEGTHQPARRGMDDYLDTSQRRGIATRIATEHLSTKRYQADQFGLNIA